MEVSVKKVDGVMIVSVKASLREGDPRERWTTENVLEWLAKNGHKAGRCLSHDVANNYDTNNLSGTWKFEIPNTAKAFREAVPIQTEQTPKKPRRSPRPARPRKKTAKKAEG